MNELKPNHICKNIDCKNPYYACDYCGKTQNWRSMACSLMCYNKYMEQIAMARAHHEAVNLYPERTDMTHEEVVKLINETPVQDVMTKTMAELSDYKDDIAAIGLNKTIDEINEKLKSKSTNKNIKK